MSPVVVLHLVAAWTAPSFSRLSRRLSTRGCALEARHSRAARVLPSCPGWPLPKPEVNESSMRSVTVERGSLAFVVHQLRYRLIGSSSDEIVPSLTKPANIIAEGHLLVLPVYCTGMRHRVVEFKGYESDSHGSSSGSVTGTRVSTVK